VSLDSELDDVSAWMSGSELDGPLAGLVHLSENACWAKLLVDVSA